MPTTVTHGLPYPQAADTSDVPRDLQALAVATDKALGCPSVGVYRNAAMDIGGTFSLITWDANRWELNTAPDAMHSTSVNPTRLVCPVAGLYLAQLSVSQKIIAAAARATVCAWALNAAVIARGENNADGSPANGPYAVQCQIVRYCNAGDYWTAFVAANSPGGPWALSVGPNGSDPAGGDTPSEASLTLLTR